MENEKTESMKDVIYRTDNNVKAIIKKLKDMEQILNHLLETIKGYYTGNPGRTFGNNYGE